MIRLLSNITARLCEITLIYSIKRLITKSRKESFNGIAVCCVVNDDAAFSASDETNLAVLMDRIEVLVFFWRLGCSDFVSKSWRFLVFAEYLLCCSLPPSEYCIDYRTSMGFY